MTHVGQTHVSDSLWHRRVFFSRHGCNTTCSHSTGPVCPCLKTASLEILQPCVFPSIVSKNIAIRMRVKTHSLFSVGAFRVCGAVWVCFDCPRSCWSACVDRPPIFDVCKVRRHVRTVIYLLFAYILFTQSLSSNAQCAALVMGVGGIRALTLATHITTQ